MYAGEAARRRAAPPEPLLRRPVVLVVAAERARVAAVLRAEGVAEVLISRRVAGGRLVVEMQPLQMIVVFFGNGWEA